MLRHPDDCVGCKTCMVTNEFVDAKSYRMSNTCKTFHHNNMLICIFLAKFFHDWMPENMKQTYRRDRSSSCLMLFWQSSCARTSSLMPISSLNSSRFTSAFFARSSESLSADCVCLLCCSNRCSALRNICVFSSICVFSRSTSLSNALNSCCKCFFESISDCVSRWCFFCSSASRFCSVATSFSSASIRAVSSAFSAFVWLKYIKVVNKNSATLTLRFSASSPIV